MREYWNSFSDGNRSPRREFLKAGLAAAAGLGFSRSLMADGVVAAGGASVTSPLSATTPVGLLEVDSIDVWCLEDNFTDILLAGTPTAIRPYSTPPLPPDLFTQRQFVTEHGFASLVTVHRNGQAATLLSLRVCCTAYRSSSMKSSR